MPPKILVAHDCRMIGKAISRVLEAEGFEVTTTHNASDTVEQFRKDVLPDGLVIDVAMPGAPGYEIPLAARSAGVAVIILVASVFRKTGYKRRPVRLYGADDYVEIHHIGDTLGKKIREQLNWLVDGPEPRNVAEVIRHIHDHADSRLHGLSPRQLAMILVSDVVLYNGDIILEANDDIAAEECLREQLEEAKRVFLQISGRSDANLIEEEFSSIVGRMDTRT